MKTTPVTPQQRKHLTAFITARPFLIWYSTAYDRISPDAIVEATLNYGDWDDVQRLIGILDIQTVARMFREQTSGTRTNYYPQVAAFFRRYFQKKLSAAYA